MTTGKKLLIISSAISLITFALMTFPYHLHFLSLELLIMLICFLILLLVILQILILNTWYISWYKIFVLFYFVIKFDI